MEVEFMSEFIEDRARQIIKRKRTKRQRPYSPFHMSTRDHSPEISSEEDKDMADTLIMLAQSQEKPNQIHQKTEKLTATNYYVYECKMCNRSFPSFQTLGGHKAGHKKAKLDVCKKKSSSVDIQQPLIHECLICGSEFLSGQALGGHMRKHTIILSSVNRTVSVTEKPLGGSKSMSTSMLSLDLNFPPPEVINVQSKLMFTAPALVDCYY